MGKKWCIMLTFLFIVLVGCTDQSEDENEDPTSINEQTVSSTRPPEFLVSVGNFNGPPKLSGYCWMKEDCNITMKDLEEILEDEHAIQAKVGSNIKFLISRSSGYPAEHLVFPERIEVKKLFNGEKTTIEVSNDNLKGPEEAGYHLYHVHAKWEGEEVFGEANYYFKLFVRE